MELFAEHPKKDSIKFIVLPLAREAIHGPGDIAVDFKETVRQFYGKLNFDFS